METCTTRDTNLPRECGRNGRQRRSRVEYIERVLSYTLGSTLISTERGVRVWWNLKKKYHSSVNLT